MNRFIATTLTLFLCALFLWAMIAGPGAWDASAAYTGTAEPGHGLVDVAPHFAGLEAGVSSESIHFVNEYGTCGWEVNECWLTTFIAGVPAAPNPLLDGAVHNDTVAQAPTRGSIIVSDATPSWNELVLGANATILTSNGADAVWAAPVVQTSTLLDNAVHTDTVTSGETAGDLIYGTGAGWDDLAIGAAGNVLTVAGGLPAWVAPGAVAGAWQQAAETSVIVAGADYTVRGGAAMAGLPQDVAVYVSCREPNSGVVWMATSHPIPVADFVTYNWVDDGAGNLEVHIYNDSQLDILCTVSYADL